MKPDNAAALLDIRDIRGPKDFGASPAAYIFIALVIFLIIAGVCIFIRLRREKKYRLLPAPSDVIAYEALAALEKKDYIHKGQIKTYYIELSDIVRHYLENRFAIRAPEMTTEEFLIKVKEESALSLEHKGLLRDFLTNCDLVKFARYQPAEAEANLSIALAKKLIDQTREQ